MPNLLIPMEALIMKKNKDIFLHILERPLCFIFHLPHPPINWHLVWMGNKGREGERKKFALLIWFGLMFLK
jgi:hypothetical protein